MKTELGSSQGIEWAMRVRRCERSPEDAVADTERSLKVTPQDTPHASFQDTNGRLLILFKN